MKQALVIPRFYYANAMIQGLEPGSSDNTYCHRLHTYDPENGVSVVGRFGESGLTSAPFKLADRSHCETNPTYLQLIPYIILVSDNDEVFIYKRGQKGNEDRLHQLFSIGLGGHIEIDAPSEQYAYLTNDTDVKYDEDGNIVDTVDVDRTLTILIAETIRQELHEEVGLELSDFEFQRMLNILPSFFTLYSDHNQVGSVHLGISGVLEITKDRLNDHEKDVIQNGRWVPFQDVEQYLKDQNGEFEEWSEICMGIFQQGIGYAVVDLKLSDIPEPDDLRDDDFEG